MLGWDKMAEGDFDKCFGEEWCVYAQILVFYCFWWGNHCGQLPKFSERVLFSCACKEDFSLFPFLLVSPSLTDDCWLPLFSYIPKGKRRRNKSPPGQKEKGKEREMWKKDRMNRIKKGKVHPSTYSLPRKKRNIIFWNKKSFHFFISRSCEGIRGQCTSDSNFRTLFTFPVSFRCSGAFFLLLFFSPHTLFPPR